MKKKDVKFLDLCLYFCAALILLTFLFGIMSFILWQTEPAELFGFIGKVCSAEGIITAVISIVKMKNEKN